jgi:hypothetical protein
MINLTAKQFKKLLIDNGLVKDAIVTGDVQYDLHLPYALPDNAKIINCQLSTLDIAQQEVNSLTITGGKIDRITLGAGTRFGTEVILDKCGVKKLTLDETNIAKLSFTTSEDVASNIDGGRAAMISSMILSGNFEKIDVFDIICDLVHLKSFSCPFVNYYSSAETGDVLFENVAGANFIFQYYTAKLLKFTNVTIERFSNKPEF